MKPIHFGHPDKLQVSKKSLTEMNTELQNITLAATAMWEFINTEMSWCDFRDDMDPVGISKKNRKKLSDFLHSLQKNCPEAIGRILSKSA